MLDYLASSKPIVLAGNPPNNLVKEANAGLTVKPGSAHSLTEGIKKMESMKETERKAMGLNGRKYVEKYYNSRMLGEKLEEIL
jgi:glycosyltransferase involved in cell wall biosynthesis